MSALGGAPQQMSAQQLQQAQQQAQRTMDMLDMSDFPALGRSTQVTTPPSLNMRATLGLGPFSKPNGRSDFSLQNEDFPALPGSIKAPRSEMHGMEQSQSPTDLHMGLTDSSLSQDDRFRNFPQYAENNMQQMGSVRPMNDTQFGASLRDHQQSGGLGSAFAHDAMASRDSGGQADRYGLYGLLNVIRMTKPDLNTLALGIDLTTLGLSLNSPDMLYKTFSSPYSTGPARNQEPEYSLPNCYLMSPSLPPPVNKMNMFSDETLFYIFYAMPRDILQQAAAAELYNRDWRFHRELKLWFTRMPGTEPTQKTPTYERGTYIYFDPHSWQKVRKDFVLAYDQLEERKPSPVVL